MKMPRLGIRIILFWKVRGKVRARQCFARTGVRGKKMDLQITDKYEDFMLSYEATIRNILSDLELSNAENILISPPPLQKLADETSQVWIQRFRTERQLGWQNYY